VLREAKKNLKIQKNIEFNSILNNYTILKNNHKEDENEETRKIVQKNDLFAIIGLRNEVKRN
jgi:hypothetical protein